MKRILVGLVCLITLITAVICNATNIDQAALVEAAAKGNNRVLIDALAQGINTEAFYNDKTLLMVAAQNGQLETAVLLLLHRATVNTQDSQGITALMYACSNGHLDVVMTLIQYGADVNARDSSGKSVLAYAKQKNNEAIVSLLVSNGANLPYKFKSFVADKKKKYYSLKVHFATNRKEAQSTEDKQRNPFGNQLDSVLHYGVCEVSIPKNHKRGDLESPSIYRFEFNEDPVKHITILKLNQMGRNEYLDSIKQQMKVTGEKSILLFIHGFNVGFSEAARRTAQLAYDLEFNGIPMFFSWPSLGSIQSYPEDSERIRETIPLLKEYLKTISRENKNVKVHIIAHSMGTYGFTTALKELVDEFNAGGEKPRFNQIMLAAPDIDAKVFREKIAPKLASVAERVTLYASSKDVALIISNFINNGRRAGDSEPNIVLTSRIDSIDVSKVDTSLLGHSYYGSNETVITDMKSVIKKTDPDRRPFLEPKENQKDKRKYWFFNPLKKTQTI